MVDELSLPKTPAAVRSWMAGLPEWATVVQVHPLAPLPFESLGLGERQAIALTREFSDGILLTDDFQARNAAESLGVRVVPTVRILATASALSLVNFEDAIRRLQETNFRISQEIIEDISKTNFGN